MGERKTYLNRRNFLKGSAVVAAGATLGLAGCSSNDGSSSTTGAWDKECDVLVVGTGTAAIAAAASSYYGADSIILLEKSKQVFGGTTGVSGQALGIPLTDVAKNEGVVDSEEEVLKYYRSATNGRYDEAVARAYLKNGNEFIKWTEEAFNFTWGFDSPAFQDYYEPCEGFLAYGRGSLTVKEIDGAENKGTWAFLRSTLEADEKSEILMGTAASKLLVEEGRVVGVVATSETGELRIKARKGVVLGTGGFDHNDTMRKDYLPFPLFVTNAAEGNTGDAQMMGMEIGAALANMGAVWGLPCFLPGGEDPQELLDSSSIVYDFFGNDWAMYRGKPGALVVNKEGKRFGDEAQAYAVFNADFGQFSSAKANYPNIPAYFICDSSYTDVYPLPGQTEAGEPLPNYFIQADTIEELAEKLGIELTGLVAELNEFNAYAKEGIDPKFGRGEKSIDINTTGLYAGSRTDIPNPCLSPFETAPFYGAVYVPGTCGTCGGLKINENAQVVKLDGSPIEGLYAVGNCSSGVSAGMYLHGGMTIGSGSVMSWTAARHMLGIS